MQAVKEDLQTILDQPVALTPAEALDELAKLADEKIAMLSPKRSAQAAETFAGTEVGEMAKVDIRKIRRLRSAVEVLRQALHDCEQV